VRAFLMFGILCVLMPSAKAVELTSAKAAMAVQRIDEQTWVLHDPDYRLSAHEVIEQISQPGFESVQWVPGGIHYWFYTPLYNISDETKWAIRANNILYDSLEFYLACDGQELQPLPRPATGLASPSLSSSLYVPFTLPLSTRCGFIQEASTVSFYQPQTYLMTQETARWQSNLLTTLTLLGLGVILGLIIYNVLLSATLHSLTYFSYVVYASIHLVLLWVISWRPEALIPDFWQPMHMLRFLSASLMIAFIVFTSRFIRPGLLQQSPGLNRYQAAAKSLSKYSFVPIGVMLWFAISVLVWPQGHTDSANSFPRIYILCSLYIPVLSLLAALGGYGPARAFLPAWSILIGSQIIGTMDLIGIISLNGWGRLQAIWGGAIEMVLLSIALGMRLRKLNADKKRAELDLVLADQLAEKQDKFISTLSHEIRTPLHALLGATGLLGKTALTPQQQRYWSTTHYAAESVHAMVDNLLDRAQLKDNLNHQQHKQTFAPSKLVFSMTELLKSRAEEKGLVIDLKMNPLPASLSGYPVVLRRVLINVISNSVKYTDAGAITVTVVWEPNELKVSVVDTGIGMSPQQLVGLRRRFGVGVESLYSQDPSSGLGLPICYELVVMVDGALSISSELGKGTCVEFSLPMECVDEPDIQPNQVSVNTKFNILAIDDVASNRMILKELLSSDGHHVTTAQDGQQALELLLTQSFDLMLTDLRMPNMGGEELLERIKRDLGLSAPFCIVVSAQITDEQQQRLDALGAHAHLHKPYTPEQLTHLIQAYAQSRDKITSKATADTAHRQMQAHLGSTKYQMIMQLYQEQLTQDLERINTGLNNIDGNSIKVAAHRIVSASQALGLTQNAMAALEIEDCIDSLVEQTSEEWPHLQQRVIRLLAKISFRKPLQKSG